MSEFTTQEDGNSEQLDRMYRGFNDDHDADTLDEFGLELPINETAGILAPVKAVHHLGREAEHIADLPVEHVVLRPVGVGPSQAGMFDDVEGTESVFVTVHPVRGYRVPGRYSLADDAEPVLAHMERSQLDQYYEQHRTVKPLNLHSPQRWQNPDRDPDGHCDALDY